MAFFKDGQFGVGVGTPRAPGQRDRCSPATRSAATRFRHLIGGSMDCISCDAAARTSYGLWKKVVVVQRAPHAVRLGQPVLGRGRPTSTCAWSSMGVITDLNTWGS